MVLIAVGCLAIDDSEIDVKGNFRQGNTGSISTSNADETNVIKRSKITVTGDFIQGDARGAGSF